MALVFIFLAYSFKCMTKFTTNKKNNNVKKKKLYAESALE